MERQGFTLIEAIVALVLSSVVIILVSGTFLIQSQYYSAQTLAVSAHDNVRVATDRLASEVRSIMEDGFVVAGAHTMTVRTPMVMAVVCDRSGSDVAVHMDGGASGLVTDDVAGIAMRDDATGTWTYVNRSWAALDGGSLGAASSCAGNGADTTWASGEFHDFSQVGGAVFAPPPNVGDLLMLFRETTFRIQQSVLDPQTLGLFRQSYGGALVEFATGIDTTAQFQYRAGGTTYADTILGAGVASIDAVRIVADARLPARSGLQEDATFGWSVNIALRNVP